jgi:uncharacterized phiE125 gp8 family phage protein
MAGELVCTYSTSGLDLYAIIRRLSDTYVYQTTTATFVTWNNANVSNYDIALTDTGGDMYVGDFPSSVSAADYRIFYYIMAGAAPAITDTLIESVDKHWNGDALVDTSTVTLSPYALTTVEKVKRLLHTSSTTDDDLITELINSCSAKIERLCNRQFLARAYTERMDGHDTHKLVVKHYPINEITAIYEVSGAGSEEETELIADTIYRYDSETGIIELIADVWTSAFDTAFAAGFLNYEVQYNGGYATIPDDVDMVCRELVVEAYNLSKRDSTLRSESLGDYSYTLADGLSLSESQLERMRPYMCLGLGGKR